MPHRPVFPASENRFWNVDPAGDVYFDDTPVQMPPFWVVTAIASHDKNGSHPDCVICQARHEQALSDYADARREARYGKSL